MDSATTDNRGTKSRAALATLGVLACHGFAAGVLVVFAMAVDELLIQPLADHDVELPSGSILSINLCDLLLTRWHALVVLLILDGVFYYLLARHIQHRPRSGWIASLWAMLPMVGALALLGFMALSLVLAVGAAFERNNKAPPQEIAIGERLPPSA